MCRFVACSSGIKVDRQTYTHTQTDRPSTVILAVLARRGDDDDTEFVKARVSGFLRRALEAHMMLLGKWI